MSEAFLIAFFLLFVLIMLLPARRAAAGAGAPQRRLGQQHPAVRPADDRLRPAVRAGAPHAVRHRALGAGDGRLLRPAGDDDEEARRARASLRCQPGDRHRLPDPGHSVRPRRAQHRRRLDARGRRPGVDRLSPGPGPAARLRLHPVRAGGRVDAVRARAPRHADGRLQRLPVQRPDGRRRRDRRRVLHPSPPRRCGDEVRRGDRRAAADRPGDALAGVDRGRRDLGLRRLGAEALGLARRRQRHRPALPAARDPAALAGHRLADGRAGALDAVGRGDGGRRAGPSAERPAAPGPGRSPSPCTR